MITFVDRTLKTRIVLNTSLDVPKGSLFSLNKSNAHYFLLIYSQTLNTSATLQA